MTLSMRLSLKKCLRWAFTSGLKGGDDFMEAPQFLTEGDNPPPPRNEISRGPTATT